MLAACFDDVAFFFEDIRKGNAMFIVPKLPLVTCFSIILHKLIEEKIH